MNEQRASMIEKTKSAKVMHASIRTNVRGKRISSRPGVTSEPKHRNKPTATTHIRVFVQLRQIPPPTNVRNEIILQTSADQTKKQQCK